MEDGDGTSAMNTHVESMQVMDGYPDGDEEEDKDDDDQCDIDEM